MPDAYELVAVLPKDTFDGIAFRRADHDPDPDRLIGIRAGEDPTLDQLLPLEEIRLAVNPGLSGT